MRVEAWWVVLSLLTSPRLVGAGPQEGKAAPAPPDMDRMLGAAQPGPVHQVWANRAGDYTTVSRIRMAPGAPAAESTGMAKLSLLLGGRFLLEENTGQQVGQAFAGRRLLGFNNGSQRYEAVWTWTLSTAILSLSGASLDGGRTVRLDGAYDDPGGVRQSLRAVYRFTDEDRFTLEVRGAAPDGNDFTVVETVYTRVRPPSR
jgi:hypothetical protein